MKRLLAGLIICVSLTGVGCAGRVPKPVHYDHVGFLDHLNRMPSTNRRHMLASVGVSSDLDDEKVARREDQVGSLAPSKVRGWVRSWQWPLKQVEVTSPFGRRPRDFHEGIDLRAKSGTAVYAASAGKISYADSKIRGYGRMVVVKHEHGLSTIYAHNSRILVRKGQTVKQGQQIAMSGNTGDSTAPHVHFEIRNGVAAVDPKAVLPNAREELYTRNRSAARALATRE